MAEQAVVLLAHGTPDSLEQIPAYLGNVTGGRPLADEVVEEIRRRYAQIGRSPLTAITLAQGRLLAAALGLPVAVGMRNWHPYIADAVAGLRDSGISQVVAICLAPQNSRTSVGLYRRALMAAAGGMRVDFIEAWAEHPLLVRAFAERLQPAWEELCRETGSRVPVLFTAHSVPARTVEPAAGPPANAGPDAGLPSGPDPYAAQARLTAARVAALVPGLEDWRFAFQSQGVSGGPWIGPTVEETLQALHAEGQRTVLLQPVGFLCDHVEILYDIDIAFREYAARLGMRLERTPSLNDSALLTAALADLARQGLAGLARPPAP
jgi:ferrochelatase